MIVIVALICAETTILNLTGSWNDDDKSALKTASARCPQIYAGNVCLVSFYKKAERTYQAICGEGKNDNR